jgi:hypothetical protein
MDARSWDIRGSNLAKLPVNQIEDKAECFTDAVVEALNKCLPDDFPRKSDKPSDSIKWLTLCVMREQVHADVALIQKRDFFSVPIRALKFLMTSSKCSIALSGKVISWR